MAITAGASARPVIARVFAMAATRAGFSLERMSEGVLIGDAIAAGEAADFAESRVGVSIEELLSTPAESESAVIDHPSGTASMEQQEVRAAETRSLEPNSRFRDARESTPSLTTPGYSMSRAELAEAVNEYLWRTTKKHHTSLDAQAIGRYERGEIRWPTAVYRSAFRAVLGVATDIELGFCPPLRAGSTSRRPIASARPPTS